MPSVSNSVVALAFLCITLPAICRPDGGTAEQSQEAGKKAFDLGRYQQAESDFRESVSALEAAASPDAPQLAAARQNIATVYFAQGRLADAEKLYRQAMSVWEATPGRELSIATILTNLSSLLRASARYQEAEDYAQRSLKILEKLGAAGQAERLRVMQVLGELYVAQGRYAAAQEILTGALADQEKLDGGFKGDSAIVA